MDFTSTHPTLWKARVQYANWYEKRYCRNLCENSQRKNVDKITVKALIDKCRISRQTFYYHFQDIMDVMLRSNACGLVWILLTYGGNPLLDQEGLALQLEKILSGASGAELANIINETVLRTVRDKRRFVTQPDLEESIEVVTAGYQKKNAILTDEEKKIVAYHETGRAAEELVFLPHPPAPPMILNRPPN